MSTSRLCCFLSLGHEREKLRAPKDLFRLQPLLTQLLACTYNAMPNTGTLAISSTSHTPATIPLSLTTSYTAGTTT
jgi:hypothetical protein